ncbi:CENP-S-like protein [Elsinoe australis]|uniref:CENP-S-like protein n=1 Tax=Elsinoe australis TaxID=40998 RepID=A0A2P8AIS2_9PEZI|nr:Centromere protein S [Elsinoe australis]TKX23203.1 CENP-S-like protein [Elsinoe australis]
MPAAPLTDTEKTERLKSALWYSIGATIDAIALEQDINATPQFIGALTELVWNQIQNASQDVEAFTKYAST